ncbi:MAG: TonB-dependent receptor [Hyphomonadaceae bacterium]
MQHRSELAVADRDWALRPYLENPQGGWSAYGMPGTFFGTAAFRDPACGQEGTFGALIPGFPSCYYQLSQTYNLIEESDQLQLYGEINVDLTDSVAFHAEALFARTEVPFLNSTSSPALQSPTATTSVYPGFYVVSTAGPNANPAAVAFAAANPGLAPDFFGNYTAYLFRPFGIGGNPLYGNDGLVGENTSEAYRISGGFEGRFGNGVRWDTAINYSVDENLLVSRDGVVNRLQRSLNGLGGPDCPLMGGTPGVGPCYFFNPFSSAIETNVFSGQPNPTYDPAIANDPRFGNNDPDFVNWLTPLLHSVSRTRLFTWDTVLDGELPISLAGGNIAWAAGLQFRRTYLEVEVDPLYDVDAMPCIDSPDYGDDSCINTPGAANGPLTFYVQYRNLTEDRDTYALFGELSIPFSDAFQVDVAARYEDHEDFGTTFNPKLSARLQLSPSIALRGSVGTSFREPLPVHTIETPLTAVAFLGGTLRQIRTAGNPNLDPEEATSYNIGAIFGGGGPFNATIDYWHFDFSDPITVEPFAAMYDALFPAVGPNNCGNAAYAQLEARFDFGGLACSSANLRRINTLWNNGAGVETSGIDVSADYTFDGPFGGSMTVGGDASYILNYDIDPTSVAGVANIQPGFDAVGLLNYGTNAYPLPEWKGNAFLQIDTGPHSFRAAVHYVDGYRDQRTSLFTTPVNSNPGPGGPGTGTGAYNAADNVLIPGGQNVDAFVTADFVYRLSLPGDATATVALINAFDEDPPFARLDMNYDPFTANPAGRIIRLGLVKRF